jgi:hypothetical protein
MDLSFLYDLPHSSMSITLYRITTGDFKDDDLDYLLEKAAMDAAQCDLFETYGVDEIADLHP